MFGDDSSYFLHSTHGDAMISQLIDSLSTIKLSPAIWYLIKSFE